MDPISATGLNDSLAQGLSHMQNYRASQLAASPEALLRHIQEFSDPGQNPVTNSKLDLTKMTTEERALYQVCRQFEAHFTSSLLKKGLTQAAESWGDDNKESGSTAYQELAFENISKYVGSQGLMGLADTLYNQLSARVSAENAHAEGALPPAPKLDRPPSQHLHGHETTNKDSD